MQEIIRCVRGYLHQGAVAITTPRLGSCVNTAFYGLFCRRKAAGNLSSCNKSWRGAVVVRHPSPISFGETSFDHLLKSSSNQPPKVFAPIAYCCQSWSSSSF